MKTFVASVSLLTAVLLPGCVSGARAAQGAAPRSPRSVSLLLAVKADAQQMAASVARTAAVIRKRCAGLRIRCELLPQPGERPNRLLLRFSSAANMERVKRVVLAQGLELRAVVSPSFPFPVREYPTRDEATAAAGDGADVLPLDDGQAVTYLAVERAAIITGDDVRNCVVAHLWGRGITAEYEVNCRLRPSGAARMKAWTGANVGRYIAVVFNGRVRITPYVRAPIWYDVSVSNFRRQEAEEVAVILSGGNLPAPVELIEDAARKP